ncbi:hypothetical protein Clacol_010167 [Clathrus columnatus]|uniref:RING-type domain-containing protein n=1 Tax=Clathrus columnatus TaxID=1419009 RepID=A0AAV5ARW8_9AGAM|nr:hypothetical protein Clacol_010167 [Clathrus columnatus]
MFDSARNVLVSARFAETRVTETTTYDHEQQMNNANGDQQRNNSSSNTPRDGNNDNDHTSTSETYVFTGTGGPELLATMQNLVNRIISRDQQSQQRDNIPVPRASDSIDEDIQLHTADDAVEVSRSCPVVTTGLVTPEFQTDATAPSRTTTTPSATSPEPATTSTAPTGDAATQTSNEPNDTSNNTNPQGRPVRPLPRPHSHFHAHTPIGVIDLFTFNMGTTLPSPSGNTASFTFNLGPEAFAGFEAMFLNHLRKEREPDLERAKTLLRGMQIVPEGLVRRLERAGGVPGGQGTEDQSAGCAVCWGPLLDGVEPGEWDTAAQKEEKGKRAAEVGGAEEKQDDEDDEFRGRIVALPCAHVYHAECLLPWFARNTTCPTCRFDIDPESLTWNPQVPFAAPETEIPLPTAGPGQQGETPAPGMFHPQNLTREDIERANAAEAQRFNQFMSTIFRGFAGGEQPGQSPQPQPPQQENLRSDVEGTPAESTQQAPVETQLQTDLRSGQASSSFTPPTSHTTTEWHTAPNPPQMFGPAPPPPPPPRMHSLPALFRLPPVPLFFIPTRSSGVQPRAQPQQSGQQNPPQSQQSQSPPHPTFLSASSRQDTSQARTQPTSQPQQPTLHPLPQRQAQQHHHQHHHHHHQPHPQVQQSRFPSQFVAFPPIYPTFHVFPGGGGAVPHTHTHEQHPEIDEEMRRIMDMNRFPYPFTHPGEAMNRPETRERENVNRPERRKWISPDPVGRTLRQRVEAKERELGLRCDDVVCLVAPSDEDPVPSDSLSDASKAALTKRVQLHGAYDSRGRLCEHSFHSACLVASARIAGINVHEDDGLEDVRRADGEIEMNKDGNEEALGGRELEISCPVCRADGTLSHQEWREGVKTL